MLRSERICQHTSGFTAFFFLKWEGEERAGVRRQLFDTIVRNAREEVPRNEVSELGQESPMCQGRQVFPCPGSDVPGVPETSFERRQIFLVKKRFSQTRMEESRSGATAADVWSKNGASQDLASARAMLRGRPAWHTSLLQRFGCTDVSCDVVPG